MADSKAGLVAAAGIGALLALAFLNYRSQPAALSLQEAASGQSFDPFVFWAHRDPVGYRYRWPAVIGGNCLPMPYQTQDIGLALNHVEVIDNAGCAQ